MSLFTRMKEPVFLKEDSNAEKQLEKLKKIEPLLNQTGQTIIRQDMKYLEYGIVGEKNIAFELKNSHMPMYILHDIYLEIGELSAQIDYLVFTKKLCYVIECKNLYGNIEITNSGDFIRTIEFGGRKKKEGIYSPITQNKRHVELMRKIKADNRNNIISKLMVEKYFEDYTKSIVVLANPKTILNARYAHKEIKEKVIRADQLVEYIKRTHEASKELPSSEEKLLKWAQSYLNLHKEIEKDYTTKYDQYRLELQMQNSQQEKICASKENETDIFLKLKKYRLEKSREEAIKPYYIYNDNQLKDLIFKMPDNEEELLKIAGFGKVKVNKYGADILKIIKEYQSE